MLRLVLPIVLALVGTGGGVAAGLLLADRGAPPAEGGTEAPAADAATDAAGAAPDAGPEAPAAAPPEAPAAAAAPASGDGHGGEDVSYAELTNQFVVPVLGEGRVGAMMVLSLSVEVPSDQEEDVFTHEPKLRDAFLQVLFDHANSGGFAGTFTAPANMRTLRRLLLAAARDILGDGVRDVLITDIVRQDMPG